MVGKEVRGEGERVSYFESFSCRRKTCGLKSISKATSRAFSLCAVTSAGNSAPSAMPARMPAIKAVLLRSWYSDGLHT